VKDLVVVDPKTGEKHNCGAIAKKRTIGGVVVYLTYSEADRFWWIVWKDERLHKLGFIEARRETCWETFFAMTEMSLAKLRAS
jgi:hypothetical protein